MFELDREIELWVSAVISCGGSDNAAELEDHLRSEIEQQTKAGLTEEAAFHAARQRLGDSELLAKEYSKNASVLSLLYQAERRLGESITLKSGKLATLIIIQSLAWAVVMIAAAAITDSAYDALQPVLLAGWFVGTMMPIALLDLGGNARSEWACLRRWMTRGRAA